MKLHPLNPPKNQKDLFERKALQKAVVLSGQKFVFFFFWFLSQKNLRHGGINKVEREKREKKTKVAPTLLHLAADYKGSTASFLNLC